MYSDDEEEYENNYNNSNEFYDSQSLILESSLGQVYLFLIIYYLF